MMNTIYGCDDLCDLCGYLRLLEKKEKQKEKEKIFAQSRIHCSRRRGCPALCGCTSSLRAKATALGKEHPFDECQIILLSSNTVLQREPNISLSAKGPSSMSAQYLALGEGVTPTPNGGAGRDGKRAFDESQGRLSTHIRRKGRGKLSAKGASPVELQREAIAEGGKGPSPRVSPLSAKTQNPVDRTTPMPKRAHTVSTSRLPLHMMRIAIAN
jgi:hypothetical protein